MPYDPLNGYESPASMRDPANPDAPAGYGPGNVPATPENPMGYGPFYYKNIDNGQAGGLNVRTSGANPAAAIPSWFPQAQAPKEEKEKEPPPPNYSEALTRAAGPGMFARFTKAPIKPSTPVSWSRFAEEGDELPPLAKQFLAPDLKAQGASKALTGTINQWTSERNARVAPFKKITFDDLRSQQGAMFGQGPIAGRGATGVANAVASMFGAPSNGAPPPPKSIAAAAAAAASDPNSNSAIVPRPAGMGPPPPRPISDAEAAALGANAEQMKRNQSAMFGGPAAPNPQAAALLRNQNAMYSTPILGRR